MICVSDVCSDVCGYRVDIKHDKNDDFALSLIMQKQNNAQAIKLILEADNSGIDVSGCFNTKHSKWLIRDSEDGYEHHYCSTCSKEALFEYVYEDMWDENLDGEMENCGEVCVDINEHITAFCPQCGAKMRKIDEK